jgi:hypothetical protein
MSPNRQWFAGGEWEEPVRTECESLADADRKDAIASGEIADTDEPGEGRTALVDNARGAKRRIINQTRRNRGMNAASLAQVKMGTEALALCIAGVLCERDPSLLAAFRESVELLYRILDDRGDHEAAAMVGAFGRALVDPAFKRPSN